MEATGKILLQIVDGTRQPFPGEIGVRLSDGNKQGGGLNNFKSSTIRINDVPCFDNRRDDYTVLATAAGYADAGFFPVKVAPNVLRPVFLMLLPKDGVFNFGPAAWDTITESRDDLRALFTEAEPQAQQIYEGLIANQQPSAAAFWNIITALEQVHLSKGTALSFFRQIEWNHVTQDRFFGFAHKDLLEEVIIAAGQHKFAEEFKPGTFHKGATSSYKQIQFGEANVQLTFHADDQTPNADWIRVEPDIDYFQDVGSHALLEVLPNIFSGGRTDPRKVYALRWIAGRQASTPEFAPPYTIDRSANP